MNACTYNKRVVAETEFHEAEVDYLWRQSRQFIAVKTE